MRIAYDQLHVRVKVLWETNLVGYLYPPFLNNARLWKFVYLENVLYSLIYSGTYIRCAAQEKIPFLLLEASTESASNILP